MVVFFLSGLALKSSVLAQAILHWRAHIGTLIFEHTLVVFDIFPLSISIAC
jgi:predicted Na+-dependent transporter